MSDRSATPVPAPARTGLIALAIVLVLGTFWGLALSVAKTASANGVPPLGYAFWQGMGAGLVLLVIGTLAGQRLPLTAATLRYALFMGAIGMAIPNAVSFTVLTRVPAGAMAVVINMVPLIAYGLALAVREEAFQPRRLIGVLVGLVGVLVLVLPDASLPDPAMTGWLLLGLLTPTFYAISVIGAARWRPEGVPSLALATGMLLAAGGVLLPVVLATGTFYVPDPVNLHLGDLALVGQIAITSAMFFLYFELLRLGGPILASLVGYTVTLAGIVWGMIIFGERHSGYLWTAVILIFAGLALVQGGQRKAAPRD
ncbi:MAG: EamA family transporter [Alphaproteobacteria bacterium]|jgi:drug/metabolite transporter (DMT)-like permease|nr:EamA family transporter [Alphaproteobacteria bacterium]